MRREFSKAVKLEAYERAKDACEKAARRSAASCRSTTDNKLIKVTQDITREWIKENMFSPDMGEDVTSRQSVLAPPAKI